MLVIICKTFNHVNHFKDCSNNIANTNLLAISSVNSMSKQLQNAIHHGLEKFTQNLKMYPYKLTLLFELNDTDLPIKNDCSLKILAHMEIEPEWLWRGGVFQD